jgi:dethiobiotin synthetase
MSAFFVTATGTDIGKTFVTVGLIRHLRSRGIEALALKPVISGYDPANARTSDSALLLSAMNRACTDEEIHRISPWRFAAPLSPDMAAAREGGAVDINALLQFTYDAVVEAEKPVFVEGVGGVMTPITAHYTVLDWIAAQQLPVIVVAGTYLGTVSHTLSAFEVLRQRGAAITALVLNATETSPVPLYDTAETIGRFAPDVPIVTVPRRGDDSHFAPLAHLCGIG